MAPKAALLLTVQLSLLIAFFISTTVHHTDASLLHHNHRPHVKPPHTASRKQVAVRGVVFCKSCEHKGINTLKRAKPLFKAVVKLQCNNTHSQRLVETTQTDKKGHFVFNPKNVTATLAIHKKCKVFLVSSTNKDCTVPTNLNGGLSGAVLIPRRRRRPHGRRVPKSFHVRPLAFEAPKVCYVLGFRD